jgi:hypothetical protein
MRKIAGLMFAVLALSLVLFPATVFAGSLDKDCSWEKVKWEENANSCFLYLDNWGKTPITAMSRLAGGAYPKVLTGGGTLTANPGSCFGSCASCNDQAGNLGGCTDPKACKASTECPGTGACVVPTYAEKPTTCNVKAVVGYAHCAKFWGVSLAFANKSWAGKSTGDFLVSRVSNIDTHPNHRGTSDRRSAGGGGDWGMTGAPHSECKADIWALQCNLDKNSACIPVKK